MIPACDHTGTPLHFHSSTTLGSASLTRARSRLSILPRQSPSSLILASFSCEGDLLCGPLFFMSFLFCGCPRWVDHQKPSPSPIFRRRYSAILRTRSSGTGL